MRTLLFLTALLLTASQAASAEPCHTIADDKDRLACYDAGIEQKNADKPATVERTAYSRSAYADRLHKWFLANGYSGYVVFTEEKNQKQKGDDVFAKHQHLFPRLMMCCHLSESMVFQLAGKGGLLKAAHDLGFKGVHMTGDGRWLYDVSNGVPRCDVGYRTCL